MTVSTDNPITDMAKRCVALANDVSNGRFHSCDVQSTLMLAAVEIDRFYLAARNWKATAEAKDAEYVRTRVDKEAKL